MYSISFKIDKESYSVEKCGQPSGYMAKYLLEELWGYDLPKWKEEK